VDQACGLRTPVRRDLNDVHLARVDASAGRAYRLAGHAYRDAYRARVTLGTFEQRLRMLTIGKD